MQVTIFHNPRCSTSRNTLAYLRDKDIEPEIVQYLKDTPTASELKELFNTLGIPVHDGIRTREAEYTELGLSPETPETELIDAIVAHPRLLQRPIVVTAKGARIARPKIDVIDSIL
ncbi:arsenate reductase [Corynebacterium glutamicum]|uniref:arsenate reductase (glutaredoxin) n=1 Tax=Corynebacterium glutamicum TaxID=1718 RepID=UPI0004F88BA3|nr:arsenate reductase (glutaredoxin) [Corynebacterium glutamicum]AIK84783.1 arsenate reductase [Corynebacterium glutamicum]AIK87567.1 arsenate reductase [Corynebacterium glutamicum]QDQ20586.1 arsenate reductase (glutaredoxin) [Corynebacterium glutamicum]QDQ24152.1 arsenate reductase (glutaredoxin) [Corynebacterium glutamicum]